VVIHGTPSKDLTAGETALYYTENWVEVMGKFAARMDWKVPSTLKPSPAKATACWD